MQFAYLIRNRILKYVNLQVTEELDEMLASLGTVDLGSSLKTAEDLLEHHNKQYMERVKVGVLSMESVLFVGALQPANSVLQ